MAEHNKSQDQSMDGFAHPKNHFYAELIRIVTGMYVGVLALMTFLLTVGFQRPHNNFKYALYTTITVLTLNLLAYLAGHMFFLRHMTTPKDEAVTDKKDSDKKDEDADKSKKAVSPWEKSRRQLRMMRLVQQVLFVLAVLSVAWLAIATAQFFFTIPTTPAGGGGAAPQ